MREPSLTQPKQARTVKDHAMQRTPQSVMQVPGTTPPGHLHPGTPGTPPESGLHICPNGDQTLGTRECLLGIEEGSPSTTPSKSVLSASTKEYPEHSSTLSCNFCDRTIARNQLSNHLLKCPKLKVPPPEQTLLIILDLTWMVLLHPLGLGRILAENGLHRPHLCRSLKCTPDDR